MVDVVIVFAILAGAVVGWRKGVIMPLATEAGALLGLATLFGPFGSVLPGGAAGIALSIGTLFVAGSVLATVGWLLSGLLHRFAVVRAGDRVLGIPLGAATAALTVYVALIATLTFDGWLGPLHAMAVLDPRSVQQLETLVAGNPTLGAFADPGALRLLAETAARAPVARNDLQQYDAALGLYENQIRPNLIASRLAPLIVSAGEGLPLVGRHVEFPAK